MSDARPHPESAPEPEPRISRWPRRLAYAGLGLVALALLGYGALRWAVAGPLAHKVASKLGADALEAGSINLWTLEARDLTMRYAPGHASIPGLEGLVLERVTARRVTVDMDISALLGRLVGYDVPIRRIVVEAPRVHVAHGTVERGWVIPPPKDGPDTLIARLELAEGQVLVQGDEGGQSNPFDATIERIGGDPEPIYRGTATLSSLDVPALSLEELGLRVDVDPDTPAAAKLSSISGRWLGAPFRDAQARVEWSAERGFELLVDKADFAGGAVIGLRLGKPADGSGAGSGAGSGSGAGGDREGVLVRAELRGLQIQQIGALAQRADATGKLDGSIEGVLGPGRLAHGAARLTIDEGTLVEVPTWLETTLRLLNLSIAPGEADLHYLGARIDMDGGALRVRSLTLRGSGVTLCGAGSIGLDGNGSLLMVSESQLIGQLTSLLGDGASAIPGVDEIASLPGLKQALQLSAEGVEMIDRSINTLAGQLRSARVTIRGWKVYSTQAAPFAETSDELGGVIRDLLDR